jgi:hypothetical protein
VGYFIFVFFRFDILCHFPVILGGIQAVSVFLVGSVFFFLFLKTTSVYSVFVLEPGNYPFRYFDKKFYLFTRTRF